MKWESDEINRLAKFIINILIFNIENIFDQQDDQVERKKRKKKKKEEVVRWLIEIFIS